MLAELDWMAARSSNVACLRSFAAEKTFSAVLSMTADVTPATGAAAVLKGCCYPLGLGILPVELKASLKLLDGVRMGEGKEGRTPPSPLYSITRREFLATASSNMSGFT